MWSVLADCRDMRARCGNLQAHLLGGYYTQPYGAGCTSLSRSRQSSWALLFCHRRGRSCSLQLQLQLLQLVLGPLMSCPPVLSIRTYMSPM